MDLFLNNKKKFSLVLCLLFQFYYQKIYALSCSARSRPAEPAICMACNIKYEAGNEPLAGQRAVVYSVYNRALNKLNGKSTLCGVIYDKNQYSWTRTDIVRSPTLSGDNDEYITLAKKIIDEIDSGNFPNQSNQSNQAEANCNTHYHTKQTNVGKMRGYPAWSAWRKGGRSRFERAGQIGGHLFSRDPKFKCIKEFDAQTIRAISSTNGNDNDGNWSPGTGRKKKYYGKYKNYKRHKRYKKPRRHYQASRRSKSYAYRRSGRR